MILYKRQARKIFREMAKSVGDDLHHHNDFLFELAKQDDWSFVIKAHAMLEAAVTEMLLVRLGEPRIKQVIERLPLSDSQVGKIVVAKQMELLDERHRRFVRFFSELRNSLVHRLENLTFNFEQHLSTLDKNQRARWKEAIVFSEEPKSRDAWEQMVEQQTKMAILLSLTSVLANCSVHSHQKQVMRKIDDASEKATSRVIKKLGLAGQKVKGSRRRKL